ncbi:GNAT family N-acetyltransferase [Planococcus koreensis]|uniref:GNAT family N-acetyltransferase n=1 Tax=Planococcus koreensis TaxID=112331 RepID=UPI0039FD5CBD
MASFGNFKRSIYGRGTRIHLRNIYSQRLPGKGFSKELMNAAIEHFQQEGYTEVRLSAKAENPAVRIYENVGFKTRTVSMSLNLK